MLKLRKHFWLSPFSQSPKRLQLSAVHHEDDELIEAIEHDRNKDQWVLEKVPDADGLDEFWGGVEKDLSNDPEWYSFADEERV